jgi:hypothetical protein
VVNWNEPEAAGQSEPEHPVPAFVTTAAADEHGHGADTAPEATAADTAATNATAADATPASATTPAATAPDNTLGIAGLGAGLLGLAAGTAALIRTRAPRKN